MMEKKFPFYRVIIFGFSNILFGIVMIFICFYRLFEVNSLLRSMDSAFFGLIILIGAFLNVILVFGGYSLLSKKKAAIPALLFYIFISLIIVGIQLAYELILFDIHDFIFSFKLNFIRILYPVILMVSLMRNEKLMQSFEPQGKEI